MKRLFENFLIGAGSIIGVALVLFIAFELMLFIDSLPDFFSNLIETNPLLVFIPGGLIGITIIGSILRFLFETP